MVLDGACEGVLKRSVLEFVGEFVAVASAAVGSESVGCGCD